VQSLCYLSFLSKQAHSRFISRVLKMGPGKRLCPPLASFVPSPLVYLGWSFTAPVGLCVMCALHLHAELRLDSRLRIRTRL